MRRITWLIALALAAGVLAAAGCGGDDDNGGGGSSGGTGTSSDSSSSSSSSGGGGKTLTVTADPGGAISWDKTSLSAKAGKVTLKIVNQSSVPHAIEVEGNGVEKATKTITGGDAGVTVDLKPGKYEYYCPVGNHKEQGMKGTLTVS
jgi:plastocyanin